MKSLSTLCVCILVTTLAFAQAGQKIAAIEAMHGIYNDETEALARR